MLLKTVDDCRTDGQTPACERQTSRKSERVEGKDRQVFFRGYSLNNACFQTDPQTPVNSSSMLFSDAQRDSTLKPCLEWDAKDLSVCQTLV